MTFENSYWNSNSVFDLYGAENPEQEIIQPVIADIINKLKPKHLLDFGCGDAYIERLIDPEIKIDLFDKNTDALIKEYRLLNSSNCKIIIDENLLPVNFYDCIILSFVLVCIENAEEQEQIFRRLKKVKNANGTLIVVNSHPCFLQYDFAAFKTSFDKENFPYLKKGMPYEVTIKQPNQKPTVSFTDYHWTLSFWINKAIECGFDLEEIIEVPDKSYKNLKANELYPPFIILKFK